MLMARKNGMGRKKKPGKVATATTKIAADLHRKVKAMCAHRKVDMFDYLDAVLRPVVERDWERLIREERGE
jgi:hypothetical protein